MKHLFSTVLMLLLIKTLWAQAPQAINYQGVARNAAGVAYASQPVTVKLSITTGAANGTVVYSETRAVTTNAFGLFNLQIGSAGASNVQGDFAVINWAEGAKFLQTEISVNNQAFVNLGTTQMMSVPYAIHSLQAKQLVFPFDTTVNSHSAPVFSVANSSTSLHAAISGQSANGDGVTGTSQSKSGVSGYSHSTAVGGVTGINSSVGGYGVHGYTAANNTSGAGVYGQSINGNAVLGNSLNGVAIKGQTNSGTGIMAVANTTGNAITAIANGYGYGIHAYSNSGTAVHGISDGTGTAGTFLQNSSAGLALNVVGALKISGANNNPGVGKVLTSNDLGIATWQNLPNTATPKVAFKLIDRLAGGLNNFSENTLFKVYFDKEEYDYGNTISVGNTTNNSVFTAPYTGVYHFDASVGVLADGIYGRVDLVKQSSNGSITVLKTSMYAETLMDNPDNIGQRQNYSVSTDSKLVAGDKVFVRFSWRNGEFSDPELTGVSASNGGAVYVNVTQFSGHMVFAE